jgi:hypothetical protein
MQTPIRIEINEWIRFQVPDLRVLEGYVQEISPDGRRILVGKAPDWPENQWYDLADIRILHHQEMMAMENEE